MKIRGKSSNKPNIRKKIIETLSKISHIDSSNINDNVILEWCSSNSSKRYPMVAAVMQPYCINEKSNVQEWMPLAENIICNSPDPVAVLKAFKSSFRPMSWSGSRADIMSKFLPLITSLKNHEILLVAEWAATEEVEFRNEIESEREWERGRDRTRDERFE